MSESKLAILEKQFYQFWEALDVKILLASDTASIFKSFIEKVNYASHDYFPAWQNYQIAESEKECSAHCNVSLFFLSRSKIVCYLPLNLWLDKSNNIHLDSNFRSVLPPIFISEVSEAERKNFQKKIFTCLCEFLSKYVVKPVLFEFPLRVPDQFDYWYVLTLERSAETFVQNEIVVELKQEIKLIKSNFRRSYKSLINRKGTLSVQVEQACSLAQWSDFHNLHQFVSGKKTRSDATWNLQYEMVKSNEAFLVQIRQADAKLLGGAFFRYSRDEAIYGSGVYDRQYLHLGLGHIAQWAAIQHLKFLGVTYHRLGLKAKPGDSEKILNISKFKQGFSNKISPIITNCLMF